MSSPGGTSRVGESSQTTTPGRPAVSPRRSWRVVFVVLTVAGIVGGGAWALLGPRLLVVRSVVVTGTHLVPKAEVLEVAGVRLGTPLIRVSTSEIASRVVAIAQVQSVQVTKSWPDRVVIAVHERTPALAVAAPGGGFDLVDPDGVTVLWAAHRPARFPLYLTTAAASLRGDPDVAAAAGVLGELPGWLRRSVASITAPDPDQVTLQLASGITVLWGGTGDASAKAEELALLMRTRARYYDVSAPGTAMTN